MECKQTLEELYENSLSYMSKDLMTHLQACKSCESEYLKIQRLEGAFLRADRQVVKSSNFVRNFSVAFAVSCLFYIQSLQGVQYSEVQLQEDSIYQIAMLTLDEELDGYNVEEDGNFIAFDYLISEEESLDIYDYALTEIENKLYNDTNEG